MNDAAEELAAIAEAIGQGRTYREFVLDPVARPRQTRADRYRNPPRAPVAKYRGFCDHLRALAGPWQMPDAMTIIFYIPMPASWSRKKKRAMDARPHQQTPDLDNLVKAALDALLKEDKTVWQVWAEKRWAYQGSIVIYDNQDEVL